MRDKEKLFDLIGKGAPISEIEEELGSDPKKNMRSINDPEHQFNMKDMIGRTPLYVACKHGYLEIVEYFLKLGANPNIRS
jgi:ankyrin repeat protein